MNLHDFLAALIGSAVFLATVSAGVTAAIFAFLANRGIVLAEHDQELIQTAAPALLAAAAYAVGVALGQFPLNADQIFALILTILAAVGGRAAFQAGAQKVQAVRAARAGAH